LLPSANHLGSAWEARAVLLATFARGIELPVLMAVIQPLLGITSHAENVEAASE
jgi:hypothetical protein